MREHVGTLGNTKFIDEFMWWLPTTSFDTAMLHRHSAITWLLWKYIFILILFLLKQYQNRFIMLNDGLQKAAKKSKSPIKPSRLINIGLFLAMLPHCTIFLYWAENKQWNIPQMHHGPGWASCLIYGNLPVPTPVNNYLVVVLLLSNSFGEAKVTDFGIVLRDQQHVPGGKVPVDKVMLLQVLHPHRHLVHQLRDVF